VFLATWVYIPEVLRSILKVQRSVSEVQRSVPEAQLIGPGGGTLWQVSRKGHKKTGGFAPVSITSI
jgi:hypothetical protein